VGVSVVSLRSRATHSATALAWRQALTGWVLLLPALAAVGLVIAFPVGQSIYDSVTEGGRWIGVDNFRTVIEDPQFRHAFVNNLIILGGIPIRIVVALVLSAILFRRIFASRFYETVIFLPFLPSVAAIGVLFIYLLAFDGPLNSLLRVIGLGALEQPWLTSSGLTMWTIMGVVVWTRVGFTVLLFTARLMSVEREKLEAAFVDGASWWRTFWHIVLPDLRGAIEFVVVLSVIEAFSWSFAYVYVLGQGANDPSRWILEIYLYNKEFLASLQGLASAVSTILLLLAATLAIYRYRQAREALE
jgi:multiple sugar transport system permease protein